jgi:hypothetical protein
VRNNSKNQDWKALCERAANEKDPATLMLLVEQINKLLSEEEQSAETIQFDPTPNSSTTSSRAA